MVGKIISKKHSGIVVGLKIGYFGKIGDQLL